MFRRLPTFVAALSPRHLGGATPRRSTPEMKTVEKLRGLTFDAPRRRRRPSRAPSCRKFCARRWRNRCRIRPMTTRSSCARCSSSTAARPISSAACSTLYESQVLAFYDPLTHTYFAHRQAAVRRRRDRRQRHAPRVGGHPRADARAAGSALPRRRARSRAAERHRRRPRAARADGRRSDAGDARLRPRPAPARSSTTSWPIRKCCRC